MNLARGSGVHGLGAMRGETNRDGIKIVRPLLDVSRRDLEQYCADNDIKYFSDEMNDDEKYTRVKIRKNRHVLSSLGISDERILLAIKNLSRARDALEQINNEQLTINNSNRIIFPADKLFSMPLELQLRFIGETLRRVGGAKYPPRLGDIERLLKKLGNDTVATLSHCAIRRLRDKILIVPEGKSTSFREKK
jgi:tRNA(Ile)-lysidine synthase